MTRFIITPKQAVELIFDALKHSVGGEVFIPILPAFKVTDLIEVLKKSLGADNKIENIGIRPGEKIHELMINNAEIPLTYKFQDRYVITPHITKVANLEEVPYLDDNNKVHESDMIEYSSKDSIISTDELKDILEKLNLI